MLYRQLRTSQVKCNFCLEWITLSLDFKFNINVCDECLKKGCQDNTLKAIASSGQLYQIYIVKQNSILQMPAKSNTCNFLPQNNQSEIFIGNTPSQNEKTELLQEIDQQRNIQIKQILQKWSQLSSFLHQKQTLSKEEITYLKNIISQKTIDLQKLNNFMPQIIENQNQWIPVEFDVNSQQNIFEDLPLNSEQTKNYGFPQININIIDKQNLPLKPKKSKNKQNISKTQQKLSFKSPNTIPLGEKDLNCLHVSLIKFQGLEKNNCTPEKRFHTQCFYENSSLESSYRRNLFESFENSERSSLNKSFFNNPTKKLNSQQVKKLEQTKNRISKYLQNNFESNSLGRLMFNTVFEAFSNTNVFNKSMELISYNLSFTDFRCYLESFDWTGIQILKLVKTKLSDEQLKILVQFMILRNLNIKVLVLTSNRLTEMSIEYLNEKKLKNTREIYLGKNRISKGKVRNEIRSLENKYSLYL